MWRWLSRLWRRDVPLAPHKAPLSRGQYVVVHVHRRVLGELGKRAVTNGISLRQYIAALCKMGTLMEANWQEMIVWNYLLDSVEEDVLLEE